MGGEGGAFIMLLSIQKGLIRTAAGSVLRDENTALKSCKPDVYVYFLALQYNCNQICFILIWKFKYFEDWNACNYCITYVLGVIWIFRWGGKKLYLFVGKVLQRGCQSLHFSITINCSIKSTLRILLLHCYLHGFTEKGIFWGMVTNRCLHALKERKHSVLLKLYKHTPGREGRRVGGVGEFTLYIYYLAVQRLEWCSCYGLPTLHLGMLLQCYW